MMVQKNKMLQGPMIPAMGRFLVPVALGFILQQLYAMADAIILGNLVGKSALAAVGGSAFSLINVIYIFFGGFSSGGCIAISQAFGLGDSKRCKAGIETAMTLSVIMGAVITVLGIGFAPDLLKLLKTPDEILKMSEDYLGCYMLGMIPALVYNMGNAILRSMGESRKPLRYLVIGTAVNVGLDYILIAFFNAGVKGAAIASAASQTLSAFLVVRALAKDHKGLWFRFNLDDIRQIMRLGLPSGLQNAMYTVSGLFIQGAINTLGTDSVAAWSAFSKLDSFFWSISAGFNVTMLTFSAQNYGAGKLQRIRKGARLLLLLDLGVSSLFSLTFCLLRTSCIRLFSQDPEVIRIGSQVIVYISAFYCLFAFTEILSAAIRGTGNTLGPSIVTFLSVCVLRLLLIYGLAMQSPSNIRIALCYPISWLASSAAFIIFYKAKVRTLVPTPGTRTPLRSQQPLSPPRE
jgi:putative MATE family efflux protein